MPPTNVWREAPQTPSCSATITIGSAARRARPALWNASIAPEVGANRDYLVDYDAHSRTGHAILYGAAAPFEIESAVRRALTLRADGDEWAPLVKTLMTSAPRWSAAAAAVTEIATQYLDGAPTATAN